MIRYLRMRLEEVLEKLIAVIEEENRQLSTKGSRVDPDLCSRKLRLLAQMNQRNPLDANTNERVRELAEHLRDVLALNAHKLAQHCESVREIWDGVVARARADASDGTYHARQSVRRRTR